MRSTPYLALLALTVAAVAVDAQAQQQQRPQAQQAQGNRPASGGGAQQGAAVAQFGDWGVFTSTTQRGKVCYAASQPKSRAPPACSAIPPSSS